ncbi:Fic family protein [Bradymonadaceae bacterium TMQ3]|nr:Fic family protein [Bradymonadaceae bacterium TMQ3]TXC75983.1 Fic family protein [Bradymonadales bacterium TMQ1]
MNLTYLEVDHQRSIYNAMPDELRPSFMERLKLCWLYHDHALEGVVLSSDEIARAMERMPCRTHCESVTQHGLRALYEAIDFIHASAERGDELSVEWLRELHQMLCMPGDDAGGRYRKRDTSPGVYHLTVAPASSISYHFHKFMDVYEEELRALHPIRQSALAHWEFMRVFPFDERTGIVGRLMLNFLLIKHRFPPAIVHGCDRHTYFAALNGHRNDMVPVTIEAIRATLQAAKTFQRQARPAHKMAL